MHPLIRGCSFIFATIRYNKRFRAFCLTLLGFFFIKTEAFIEMIEAILVLLKYDKTATRKYLLELKVKGMDFHE